MINYKQYQVLIVNLDLTIGSEIKKKTSLFDCISK